MVTHKIIRYAALAIALVFVCAGVANCQTQVISPFVAAPATAPAAGPITFDQADTCATTAQDTITFNATIGDFTNQLFIIDVYCASLGGSDSIRSVKLNNVACTWGGRTALGGSYLMGRWYMKEAQLPAAGTYTVEVITGTAAGTIGAITTCWYNVNQTTPLGTFASNGPTDNDTLTVDVATTSVDEIVSVSSFWASGSVALTALTAGATEAIRNFGGSRMISQYIAGTGSTVTMRVIIASSRNQILIGNAIKPL